MSCQHLASKFHSSLYSKIISVGRIRPYHVARSVLLRLIIVLVIHTSNILQLLLSSCAELLICNSLEKPCLWAMRHGAVQIVSLVSVGIFSKKSLSKSLYIDTVFVLVCVCCMLHCICNCYIMYSYHAVCALATLIA